MLKTMLKVLVVFTLLDGIVTFHCLTTYPGVMSEANPLLAVLFGFEPMVASMVRLAFLFAAVVVLNEMGRWTAKFRMAALVATCIVVDVEVFAVLFNLLMLCYIAAR